ncbi:hypothetical protein LCGC14_2033370 [marine sediment metagenome]|uniref:Uncharacterized protein n=1 Tax=marine sediment metagenome TaxID=412755 RepID=A0A0F9FGJ8_9ZZZZ
MKTEQVAIVSFDGMIRRKSIEIKRQLSVLTQLSEFQVEITIKGRVHDGDLKFKYSVGPEYGPKVTGNNLDTAVEEFMRRQGWEKDHAPLQISQGEQNEYEI